MNTKFDRRRKYYMILDCETATLPYANNFSGKAKQNISIAKPLIYDLGWQVVDRHGRVYAKRKFLITEIFSVPAVFDTAYYAEKRPIYLDMLRKGEIELVDWKTATAYLEYDLQYVESVGAYNAMFDYKKAIPFTELYINMLLSPNYYKWEKMQQKFCDMLAVGDTKPSEREFDGDNFTFRGIPYPMFDLWGLTCEYIINNDEYKQMCQDNGWITASGKYFKTSAETSYRYFKGELDFEEAHTAMADAEIETELFAEIVKRSKNKYTMGIQYFPFRMLGSVEMFEIEQAQAKEQAMFRFKSDVLSAFGL
jgi:hypothetical protein